MDASPITIYTDRLEPSDPSLPAVALHVTKLTNSYMLWVGVTDAPPKEMEKATLRGQLCKDWACAMPPIADDSAAAATPLFRSAGSDVSLSMAQRLAKRFKKQIFLSVDIPPSFLSMGEGVSYVVEAEKGIVKMISQLENP